MQIAAPFAASLPFQRFAAALGALIPEWVVAEKAPPLLLAVSGGPDSLAMMAMAAACFPNRVAAMTVDHGLRVEAADEARYVAQRATELGVPHSIASPKQPITGNLQSNARTARYALLSKEAERLGGAYILTAHHADDQLETMLMRLARGSGVSGLSGIRPVNGRLIRPMLGFRKDELRDVCAAMGWHPIEDPSNADDHFDRVAMRQILAQAPLPVAPDALSRSTKALREADIALNWMADTLAPTHLHLSDGEAVLTPSDLPNEVIRRLMLRALAHMEEDHPRGDQVERAMADLTKGRPACIGHVLLKPRSKAAPKWHFAPAPPRKVGK